MGYNVIGVYRWILAIYMLALMHILTSCLDSPGHVIIKRSIFRECRLLWSSIVPDLESISQCLQYLSFLSSHDVHHPVHSPRSSSCFPFQYQFRAQHMPNITASYVILRSLPAVCAVDFNSHQAKEPPTITAASVVL